MKKTVLAFLVLALSVGPLAGCGKETGSRTKKTKVIKVLSNGRHDMDIRKAQVERFNAENTDGIFIEYEVKDDGFSDALKIAYQANTAPDIHSNFSGALSQAAVNNKWLRPLDEEMAAHYQELFINGAVKRDPVDKRVYSVGFGGLSGFKMVWNKDLFAQSGLDPEKPPAYWSEVREYAKIIAQSGGGRQFGFALPFKDEGLVRLYAMMPGSPSGLYNTDGYDPKTGRYDFSIYKSMLQLFIDMNRDGSLFPTPGTLDNDSARAQFSEGNVGIMFAATWDVGVFNDQFPAKIDWGVSEFPTFDGLKGGYPAGLGAGGFSMNAASRYPDEQLKVWQWLICEEVLTELQLEGKGPFGLKSIMKPALLNNSKKGAVEFAMVREPVRVIDQPSPNPNALIKVEGDTYAQIMTNIVLGNVPLGQGLADLDLRYNQALDKYARDSGQDMSQFVYPDYDPVSYVIR